MKRCLKPESDCENYKREHDVRKIRLSGEGEDHNDLIGLILILLAPHLPVFSVTLKLQRQIVGCTTSLRPF